MRKLRVGRGIAMVELDDGLERGIGAALDRLAPGLLDRLETGIDGIALDALTRWPVKTGASKRAMEWGVRLPDEDHLEGFVVNTAEHSGKEYAYLIQPKGGGKPVWRTLVVDPMLARADRIAESLADEAAAIIRGE